MRPATGCVVDQHEKGPSKHGRNDSLLSHICAEARGDHEHPRRLHSCKEALTHRPSSIEFAEVLDQTAVNRHEGVVRAVEQVSCITIGASRCVAYFMNATMGLMKALFVYDRSFVNIGTAALKSRNLRSMSMITLSGSFSPCCSSVRSDGALRGGFASSRCPGIRSATAVTAAVEIASAISPMIAFRGMSSEGSRGNLMSRTASTFPDVIQDMGPSCVVIAWM